MLIYEFRIVLPLKTEEYHRGQLYSVAVASENETGGGEGIEVVKNEPVDDYEGHGPGQHTHKLYHLQSKVPKVIRALAPRGSLEIHETAWNCFPYIKTVISNPDYMKDNFFISIESMHFDDDLGQQENVHNLTPDELKRRVIINIDIANDEVDARDYKPEWDPKLYSSTITGRGPLKKDWKDKDKDGKVNTEPLMCAYKLVKCEFKWWGLQSMVESRIMKVEERVFRNFHRQVFCWLDEWVELTMEDIRKREEESKHKLNEQRLTGESRGMSEK